uniref:Uncharacterized protein n=1 Tax=Periophthalmus magnuspinnatus TaxID=409849 RepID=A0A3B4AEF9_9GOBI
WWMQYWVSWVRHICSKAPSLGFFMLGLSAGISTLAPFSSFFNFLPKDELSWASEVLALTFLSFELLWLSEDHNTAYILLCGSCLLVALKDWLSPDAFSLMNHCLCLSSLSCCLTVCLFTGNALGAFAGLALALPLTMASTAATEELLEWILRGVLCVGCWASKRVNTIWEQCLFCECFIM